MKKSETNHLAACDVGSLSRFEAKAKNILSNETRR